MSIDAKIGALDAAIAALKATVNQQYGGTQADAAFKSYIPELGVDVGYTTSASARCMHCHYPCDLVEEAKPLTDPPTDWHVSHCCKSAYSGLSNEEAIQVVSVQLRGLELIGKLTLDEIHEFEEEARDHYEQSEQ